ncbi:MAG: hypothetical protein GY866_30655, partial [Proteobacteria bacterium]|nr:hypothetical protein [Pseudomonadota bacterium]
MIVSPRLVVEEIIEEPDRPWTILVYMNGDNDLEAEVLRTLNEMEAAEFMEGVEVLVLADRAPGYEQGDGDWTGTRLYHILPDSGGDNFNIVSERIACPGLGITAAGADPELNLGSPGVLLAFISFGQSSYPSDNTMVVLWGQRGEWSSSNAAAASVGFKAYALDETDSDFLYTSELGVALENKSVDIIGFDTGGSMLLETACEIMGSASYMAGSEDSIASEGWDYRTIISELSAGDGSVAAANQVLYDSFFDDYGTSPGGCFSVVDLSLVDEVATALDDFVDRRTTAAAASGDSIGYYTALKDEIIADIETFATSPGDRNIDLAHLGRVIEGDGSDLTEAVNNAVVISFASDYGNPEAEGLGVHLVPVD